MTVQDIPAAVALQKLAFPPPFSEELHWDAEHLEIHIHTFPEGQFVAEVDSDVIGTCSNTLTSEAHWQAHGSWYRTVGGPDLRYFDLTGSTLYGLDITVHPSFRRQGVGRGFYELRFDLVRSKGIARYGTGCRMPDYRAYSETHPGASVEKYADAVVAGHTQDRTLTPLLRYGLTFLGVVRNYMPDPESDDCGALLEWKP